VTEYRLYGATSGPGSQVPGADDYTLGMEFYVTSAAWLTKIHFWSSTVQTGSDHASRLYSVVNGSTGTLIPAGTQPFPSPLQVGWNTIVLEDPIELTPNQRYRIATYFTTDDGYTATALYWSTGPGSAGLTSGVLKAPQASDVTGGSQGSFNSPSDSFPVSQYNSTNYWLDVTVSDTSPGPITPVVSAGADITITLGASVSRTATATNTPTSWAWSTTAGPGSPASLGTSAALAWTPTSVGTYTVQAAATNAAGTGTDSITVTVNAPPPPPGRSFGPRGMFAA
jgi:hypothetical protein